MAMPSAGSLAERSLSGCRVSDSARSAGLYGRLGLCRSQLGSSGDGLRGGFLRGTLQRSSILCIGDPATWRRHLTPVDLISQERRLDSRDLITARASPTLAEVEAEGEEWSVHKGGDSGDVCGCEDLGEAGDATVPPSLALQLEMQLLSPGLLGQEWGASTPEGVRSLIVEIATPGPTQKMWQQLVSSVALRRTSSEQTGARAVQSSGESPRQSPTLQQRRRPLGMILLETCLGSLLGRGHMGSTLVGLIQHMVEQGLVPDAPLALFLLEELWVRGDQEAAVELLVLLLRREDAVSQQHTEDRCQEVCQPQQKEDKDLATVEPSSAIGLQVDQLRAVAKLSSESPAQHRTESARERLRHADDSADVLDLRTETSKLALNTAPRPVLDRRKPSADRFRAGDSSSSTRLAEAGGDGRSGGGVAGTHQADVRVDSALEEQRDTEPLPGGADAPWAASRVGNVPAELRRAVTAGEPLLRVHQEAEGRSVRVERLARLRSEVKRRMREEVALSLEQVPGPSLSAAGARPGPTGGRLSPAGTSSSAGHSGDTEDLLLHVLRCAVDRGQFRAALALPRRMRQEGVRPSVAAYDAALLAVVKEQELLADAEHEVQELQSLARVERLSPVDQLVIQVYGETLRAEGEAILDWALHELCQTDRQAFPGVDVPGTQEMALVAASQEASLHEKMLALWCLAGEGAKGERALWRMAEVGRPLSRDVVAAVLGTCAYKGSMEAVHRVLSRAEAMGMKLDSALFSLVVGAALKGGHLQAAAAAMLSMVERGLSPERTQMASLLRLLQRDGHVESYLVLSSALSGAGFIGPCLVYFYLDFIQFCIIRML